MIGNDVYTRLELLERQQQRLAAGPSRTTLFPIGAISANVLGASPSASAGDNAGAINEAATLAKARRQPMSLRAGSYNIDDTIVIDEEFGFRWLGDSTWGTTLVWTGAAGGTMLRLKNLRESHLSHLYLQGDGTTTAIELDASSAASPVTTSNVFEELFIDDHAIGIRIGQSNYQADQCVWRRCRFNQCTTAGVSIEDANAVFHSFYDCLWNLCGLGITAARAGTGGHFNLYDCGFTANTDWDVTTWNGSRPFVLSGCWSESGVKFLKISGGSTTRSIVDVLGCNVNTFTAADSVMIDINGPSTLNMIGGRYRSGTATPAKIKIGTGTAEPAHINLIGANFDGHPFSGVTGSAPQEAVINQLGATYTINASSTAPDPTLGPITYGSASVPLAHTTNLLQAPAAWLSIASGTVLAAGDNTFTGASLLCKGSTNVIVDAIQQLGGLTTQAPLIWAVDAGAGAFTIHVTVSAGFTLTSSLRFRVRFEPAPVTL